MRTSIGKTVRCAVVNALFLAAAENALAGAHTWKVNEVFSNYDGTIQFVELQEGNGTAFETGVNSQSLLSSTKNFTIGGAALTPPTSNKFFLLGTAAFAALPGAPPVDRTIPAGVLPFFFSIGGDTVTYGPYDSLNFGTVPINGTHSLNRSGGPAANLVNSPTNYAGQTGSVDAGGPPSVPALEGLGVGLVIGLILLGGIAVVLRSRSKTA